MNQHQNQLYPVFFRLDRLNLLIVGAGEVSHEKLSFLLKSSPNARITVLAPWISKKVRDLTSDSSSQIQILLKEFDDLDVLDYDIIIAATNIHHVNLQVHCAAKRYGKIVNVADTPALCDFYMGAIVTRGDLKIAISTNGKSPTFAKRFRQLLEQILPAESNDLINNLKIVRDKLQGNFHFKVKELNRITKSLVAHE